MRVKGHRASTLQPKWLSIHREAQHLQRRLERSIRSLSLLTNYTIARRDLLASCHCIPTTCCCATPTWLINYFKVEDNPTSLHLPRFDSTVKDTDGLRERGYMHAGGGATWAGKGGPRGIRARQRASRHPVTTMNVFL